MFEQIKWMCGKLKTDYMRYRVYENRFKLIEHFIRTFYSNGFFRLNFFFGNGLLWWCIKKYSTLEY